jgi:hypothetical protein
MTMRRGKLFVLPALVLLAGFLVTHGGHAAQSQPRPPRVALESLEHSFGAVPAGTPLSYTFVLKNKGKGPLQVLSVKPSCGCTKGEFDSLTAPGKEGKITLSIAHTEKYVGKTVKTATVTTNDPEHATFVLTLRAEFISKQPGAAETQ